MRVIIVDNNQFVNCVEDVNQVKFTKDNLIIELPNLDFRNLPLNNKIVSIGLQDISAEKIADLEAKLAEKNERLKAIDNWKENYGYTNYEDIYMLEDLQSRAFQSEDDTNVVNKLLDYLNISDENEILPTIKQQLAESEEKLKLEERNSEMWFYWKEIYYKGLQKAKQQLAEKEQRVAELEDKDWYEACIKQLEEQNGRLIEERDTLQEILENTTWSWNDALNKLGKQDQGKIEFAVEHLEKMKKTILEERKITSFKFDIFNKGKDTALFWLNEEIDNQIKQLKASLEDKEGK